MLRKKEIFVFFVLFVVGAATYMASAIKVQALRDKLDPTQSVSALNIKPEVLEIVSGEFHSLLADYLLVKASVYLGGRWGESPDAKKAVAILFRHSATLDPYFFQTCYFVQGYLPWWKGEYVREAIDILQIIKEHRAWHWEPSFYIGFDYFYFLKDNITASRYLMEASKLPNSFPFLGLLGARLSQQGGNTQASMAFLKAMYESTENKKAKEEIQTRIGALNGVLIIEKAIAAYISKKGSPPGTLDQLVEAGILDKLPTNPNRKNGLYLYEKGKIDF